MKPSAFLFVALLGMTGAWADQPATAPPPVLTPVQERDMAFLRACYKGDASEAQRLLDAGANLECRDSYGRTPLFVACHGDTDVVRLLLAHGAKADVVDNDGDTTVGRACEYGDLESAKMVLAAGADLNRVNKWGRTPLMLAAREGHDDVVAWLIQQKVDVSYHATNVPALYFAVDRNHYSIAKMLLDAGARADVATAPVADVKPAFTYAALAARTNDPQMIDLVLDHGARIDERDVWGRTAFTIACIYSKPETVSLLLNRGADVNTADSDGLTPLMVSADVGSVELTRLLLGHGARINDRDREGRTSLIHAAIRLQKEPAEELVGRGADVNITDSHGETALTYAGDRGAMKLVLWLESVGAKRTDLHIIPKPEEDPPLSPAHRWALAVGALYAQANGDSHGRLADPDRKLDSQTMLRESWAIKDRPSLLGMVNALMRPRTLTYTLAEQTADCLSRPKLEDKEVRAFQLLFFDLWWLEKTNVGWNYCRAANLVRNGVEAGYLSENDAWPILMAIARRTQAVFSSWHEMSDNFLDDREIGADKRSGNYRTCARLLLNPKEPNSPWNQVPWKTDLTGP